MTKIHWNDAGIRAALNAAGVATEVEATAELVADEIRREGSWDRLVEGIPGDIDIPVKVSTYTSDRPRASVHLAHPSGLAVQAKNGALTKAAAALGLEVNG